MELNKKSSGRKTAVNPEGSTVLERSNEIQLYLEASNLNLKKNSFYTYAEDKLENFLKLAKEMDSPYVLGLARFLSDRGLKTSPVVLTSVLSDKKFSFKEHPEIVSIFNTPSRISESVALNNLDKVKLNNSFKKNILRIALEEMREHTLRKNKLKSRNIKLRDLIKLLRPRPKTKEIAKLYKAIIENSKMASLKDTDTNIVAIKSSTRLDKETKKKILGSKAMLDEVPINQLIRNLKFYAEEFDFDKNIELQKKIKDRLASIKNYKILNVFDIITASIFVPQFEKLLFEVVKGFIDDIKKSFDYGKDVTVLFDTSGSMTGWGDNNTLLIGFKYLVLYSALFDNVTLRCFADELQPESTILKKVINGIKIGSIGDAWKIFHNYANKNSGGTSLISSMKDLIKEYPKQSKFVVISDEVSWESNYLIDEINDLSSMLKNKKLILINPSVYKGTVFKENIVAVSSLNPSILLDMAILFDEKGFINYIRNYDGKKERQS